jgi:hypothetical protein
MMKLPISLRAYVHAGLDRKPARKAYPKPLEASEWTFIFDTETTTDPSQHLRFGCYQLRKGSELFQAGLFYDADAVTGAEQGLIIAFAKARDLECMPVAAFIDDVFYGMAYELRASFVGFNLPFDLSRLAIKHGPSRGKMRGGFSFQLSQNPWLPRVQIKHLSSRSALIQFAGIKKRTDTRGMRKRDMSQPLRRGSFIDVKTIAAALTSQSFSLARLAEFLKLPSRKAETDDHGKELTPEYISYAVQDVQVTWEAFEALRTKFGALDLTSTALNNILSEASLGKAYLKDMGIVPWRKAQPDFPPAMIGTILSTYFGGRAEVRIRRKPVRMLHCDFLSMYPTVCTLMGLWRFVIGQGVVWKETTTETTAWLSEASPGDLQQPENWRRLPTLVQIEPDDDILPVRAKYDGNSTTIGLNYLSADQPLWFTLADCLASKFLNGKTPRIIKAITFEPGPPQSGLTPVKVAGHCIDPLNDDFYRQLINERTHIKNRMRDTTGNDHERLDSEQQALKILANATSYGIFIEINVDKLKPVEERICEFGGDESLSVSTDKAENPGTYFHPLLGTLITGAARLMLALTERAISDAGLDWAFCDTDSMAIAKPEAMPEAEFLAKAKSVCDWFLPLNPYEQKGPLLKIEDANFEIGSKAIIPLYCLATSSKRYVLFNRQEDGTPVIRKASAHGLGHLTAPYEEVDAPLFISLPSVPLATIGVHRWHYDLWFQIIMAADSGNPAMVPLDYHHSLQQPAVSRYAATTPELLRWFKTYNANRPYCDQVKPFNFLCALQTGRFSWAANIKPVAPYFRDHAQAIYQVFDRETGKRIDPTLLSTYTDALAQYHLSPEMKFENGDYDNTGKTRRRHIHVTHINLIGKESNKWEEQFFLGLSDEADPTYGTTDTPQEAQMTLRQAFTGSDRQFAELAGISRNTARKLKTQPEQGLTKKTIARISTAIALQEAENQKMQQLMQQMAGEIQKTSLSEFARRINCDTANLSKIMAGKRKMSTALTIRVMGYFDQFPKDISD